MCHSCIAYASPGSCCIGSSAAAHVSPAAQGCNRWVPAGSRSGPEAAMPLHMRRPSQPSFCCMATPPFCLVILHKLRRGCSGGPLAAACMCPAVHGHPCARHAGCVDTSHPTRCPLAVPHVCSGMLVCRSAAAQAARAAIPQGGPTCAASGGSRDYQHKTDGSGPQDSSSSLQVMRAGLQQWGGVGRASSGESRRGHPPAQQPQHRDCCANPGAPGSLGVIYTAFSSSQRRWQGGRTPDHARSCAIPPR